MHLTITLRDIHFYVFQLTIDFQDGTVTRHTRRVGSLACVVAGVLIRHSINSQRADPVGFRDGHLMLGGV